MKNINQTNDVERKLDEADKYAKINSTRLEMSEVVIELKKVIENLK